MMQIWQSTLNINMIIYLFMLYQVLACNSLSCTTSEKDQSFAVLDYGPEGIIGPVTLNLPYGLKPGATINAVIKTDVDMAINIRDQYENILIHVVSRVVSSHGFALNSFFGSWGPEEKVFPPPVAKGCRFSATLVYEQEGYRVFVNGVQLAFYRHRSANPPHKVEVNGGQVYKFAYFTLSDI